MVIDQSHPLPTDMMGLSCKSSTSVGVVSMEGLVSSGSSNVSRCRSWMYFDFKCFKYDLHHKNSHINSNVNIIVHACLTYTLLGLAVHACLTYTLLGLDLYPTRASCTCMLDLYPTRASSTCMLVRDVEANYI